MRTRYFCLVTLVGAFFGTSLMAQEPSARGPAAIPISIQQTMTTGMVGFTANQTARLNVLNLNPVPAIANTQPNCTVGLQFFDAQNHSLKQSVVPNFAPQTATSLDLSAVPAAIASLSPPAPPRQEIRGAVTVNPAPSPVMSPAAVGYCSVMVSLEIFDNTTGSTVALTTDTRAIGIGGIVPLGMMRNGNWALSPVPK